MTRLGLVAVSTVATLALFGPASAEEFVDPGGYLVLGGITAFEQFQDTGGTPIENSLGFEIRGGYRFTRNLSVEGQLDFWSGFDLTVDFDDAEPEVPDTGELTVDGGIFTANVKAALPFGRIQPYALAGLGGMWARLRSTYPTGTICTPGYWGWWCENT